jgi:hypothetical protein
MMLIRLTRVTIQRDNPLSECYISKVVCARCDENTFQLHSALSNMLRINLIGKPQQK